MNMSELKYALAHSGGSDAWPVMVVTEDGWPLNGCVFSDSIKSAEVDDFVIIDDRLYAQSRDEDMQALLAIELLEMFEAAPEEATEDQKEEAAAAIDDYDWTTAFIIRTGRQPVPQELENAAPNPNQMRTLQEAYPPGVRVTLDSSLIDRENLPLGTEGTVLHAGDRHLLVQWDTGRTSAVFPDLDRFHITD